MVTIKENESNVKCQGKCVSCPAKWEPVCDTTGRTRSNKCYADIAGVNVRCQVGRHSAEFH